MSDPGKSYPFDPLSIGRYLEKSKGSTIFGHDIESLTREELITALYIMGNAVEQARADSLDYLRLIK